jgi:hypothetical protein
LPTGFRDIADFVPVPDSQFVFQDMTKDPSTVNLGQLVIELVDVSEVADSDAIQHCFNDLAEANGAQHTETLSQG